MPARMQVLKSMALAAALALALPAIASAASDNKSPSTPGGLKTTSVSATSMAITWNASSDNVGVTGYRVYRNGTLVESPTSRTYTFTGLKCATRYILMVVGRDGAGNKSLPAVIFASTAACPPATPPCPTPATVFGLLLEHKISYGCNWPDGFFAKQALQSIRTYLASRGTLETWRGRRWHREALDELDIATSMSGAWGTSGNLQPNKYGASALAHLQRVIRILHYNNPELYNASKTEKWAVAATVWYITGSEYNRHYKAGGTNIYDMRAALLAIKRGDEDFFASNSYRASGRYLTAFRRLNQLF